jgi:hypothetical protein
MLNNNPGFVLGNGRSRLAIECSELSTYGTVYGCNAIYREFDPDYLIAVDSKMVNEIVSTGYQENHQVWTNPSNGIVAKKHLNFFDPHKGWSSGPTALWFAASNGHLKINILGFDFQGIDGKFNNVYADTYNYKKSNEAATYYGNWLNQTQRIIEEFKHIKFTRVVEEDAYHPDILSELKNLNTVSYDEFLDIYPNITRNQLKNTHFA